MRIGLVVLFTAIVVWLSFFADVSQFVGNSNSANSVHGEDAGAEVGGSTFLDVLSILNSGSTHSSESQDTNSRGGLSAAQQGRLMHECSMALMQHIEEVRASGRSAGVQQGRVATLVQRTFSNAQSYSPAVAQMKRQLQENDLWYESVLNDAINKLSSYNKRIRECRIDGEKDTEQKGDCAKLAKDLKRLGDLTVREFSSYHQRYLELTERVISQIRARSVQRHSKK